MHTRTASALLCGFLAIAACSSAPPAVAPEPPAAPTSSPRAPAPVEVASKAGPAYFGFKTRGLTRLDIDGNFTVFTGELEWVRDIAQCGDELWVTDARMGELYRASGTKLDKVEFEHFAHKPKKIHCSDGETWGNAQFGVVKLTDGKWAYTERAAVDAEAALFDGMTLDASGNIWLFGRDGRLYTGRDDKWQPVDAPTKDGEPLKPRALAAGRGGAVYIAGDQGIFRRTAKSWESLHPGPVGYEPAMAVGEDDTLYIAIGSDILIFSEGQAPPKTEEMGGSVSAIALDEAGRLWAGVEGKVTIIGTDGTRTQWPLGAFPELSGEIEQIAVVGTGPPLPEAPKPKTGTVTGTVLVGGTAKAGVIVAICANPMLMSFNDHPCEKGEPNFKTTTAADGSFSLEGVPSGTFYVAAGEGSKWSMSQRNLMVHEDGATASVGTISLK